jgi:3-hydroxybutyryl-CoA dehydrogenase
MRIAIKANAQQKQEWLAKQTSPEVELLWMQHETPDADAYFDLTFEDFGPSFQNITDKPVFINSVINTSNEIPNNASRINAWTGFLQRDIIEVVLKNEAAAEVLKTLGWKYRETADVPGMIAARTIAMIINEAYFALGDEISTKSEIDTAMKLGTNYPLGPFEWSEKIGLHNIYRLLKKLSASNDRYQPAPDLEQELKTIA